MRPISNNWYTKKRIGQVEIYSPSNPFLAPFYTNDLSKHHNSGMNVLRVLMEDGSVEKLVNPRIVSQGEVSAIEKGFERSSGYRDGSMPMPAIQTPKRPCTWMKNNYLVNYYDKEKFDYQHNSLNDAQCPYRNATRGTGPHPRCIHGHLFSKIYEHVPAGRPARIVTLLCKLIGRPILASSFRLENGRWVESSLIVRRPDNLPHREENS